MMKKTHQSYTTQVHFRYSCYAKINTESKHLEVMSACKAPCKARNTTANTIEQTLDEKPLLHLPPWKTLRFFLG